MIAIFAGSGELPLSLYQAFERQNEPYVVVACSTMCWPPPEHIPTLSLQWGKVGATLDFLNQHKVKRIVMAGAVSRPEKLSDLKVDWRGVQWLGALRSALQKGDDSLLQGITALFEKEGFIVCAAQDFLSANDKITTICQPSEQHLASIRLGTDVLKALSPYDIGQALVVAGSRILGIEGPEGTDALIQRCSSFLGDGDGILVKMAKTGQSLKVDLPTLGAQTMALLCKNGYKGVAFGQQTTHVMQPTEIKNMADQYNVFVLSF